MNMFPQAVLCISNLGCSARINTKLHTGCIAFCAKTMVISSVVKA